MFLIDAHTTDNVHGHIHTIFRLNQEIHHNENEQYPKFYVRTSKFDYDAEILGDPYSKKSPLTSICEFPSVCHPTYSRLSTTWPTSTSAATHYTQQPP
jgi:hypothetical protein